MLKRLKDRRFWIPLKLVIYLGMGASLLQAAPSINPTQQSTSGSAPVPPSSPATQTSPLARLASATERAPTPRLTGIEVRSELSIPHWLRPGEFAWNDEGAPAGPTVIVVNIRARVLSVYRAGVEIGRSSLIYGADNKPTPLGTFPILEKRARHVSNLYDAPMPHMQRLTWDGVALHGSAALADDLATRGCVGLPEEFAELLFSATKVGDQVVIWSGEADTSLS